MVNKTHVDALLRTSILGSSSIKRKTGSRVSPSQLASIVKKRGRHSTKGLQYPCITFETRDIVPIPEMSGASWFPMTLWVWTRNDRDKAHDLYSEVVTQIANERFSDSNINLVIRIEGDLIDVEDEEASLTGVAAQWMLYASNR